MKREDFKIEGIPEGYRVYDVDLTPSGRPVAVLGHKTEKTLPVFARWHGADVPLPDDALWWNDHAKQQLLVSIVRAAGEDQLTIVSPRAESNSDINARPWSAEAEIQAAFHAGDDIKEVLASADLILLFYSDVGQIGDISLSREAMAVVATNGEYLWGHRSQFGKAKGFDTWFHAAVWNNRDNLSIFADVAHDCAFVHLDVKARRQDIWRPPRPIAAPSAVTTIGDRALLHGVGTDAAGREFFEAFPNDPRAREMLASHVTPDDVVEWRPGETTWHVIGEWPDRQLRGLPGGRFIAVQPDGYTILSFE